MGAVLPEEQRGVRRHGQQDAAAGRRVLVAVGVAVAPAMPVAAVVGPVWFADDEPPLDEEDDEVDEELPLVVGAAAPLVPTVPTGVPGTDVSADDVDSGEVPVPATRTPVKSWPVTETSASGSLPPLMIAPASSASPPSA